MKKDELQTEAIKRLWAKRLELSKEAYQLSASFLKKNQRALEGISFELEVDERYVERQFLLHCPNYHIEEIGDAEFLARGSAEYNIVFRRSLDHKMAASKYEPEVSVSKGFRLLDQKGETTKELRVESVLPQQARLIEGQLHYMQSFRPTATRRLGLYHKSDAWPFCYTSVATCDRSYMHGAIEAALGKRVDIQRVAILSRIYASREAPKNSISFLISRVMKLLEREGFDLFVTASNPFLRFSAASLAGSNYVPFAHSPVAYNYDSMGLYRTRRAAQDLDSSDWKTPRNFLYMKSLYRPLSKKVRLIPNIVKIGREKHGDVDVDAELTPLNIERSVTEVRLSLEGVWGDETRYHGTEFNPKSDPLSKGQCGVTSAYLARLLQSQGHSVFFCEGDAHFQGHDSIEQHCWLVLPKGAETNKDNEDIVIDITADQSGYERGVVCDTVAELTKQGIVYDERSRTLPAQVGVDHVRARLKILQGGLKSRNTRGE